MAKKPQKKKLSKVSEKKTAVDIQIAAGAATMGLISQQGLQSIDKVIQGSNDPVKALAHVIFMALSKVREMLVKKGLDIDHRIWIMGGGVLDRVIFEVMYALATVLKFKLASNPQFVHQVKSATLDLMNDDDQNSEAIKVLHDKGLPMPKAPPGASGTPQGGQPPQGLVAPQGQPQQAPPQQQMPPNQPQPQQPMMGGR